MVLTIVHILGCRGGEKSGREEGGDQKQDQSCWKDGASLCCSQVRHEQYATHVLIL